MMTEFSLSRRVIGKVAVVADERREALSRMQYAVRQRQPGAWGFCNAHTVNMAATDSKFCSALHDMTLFNDGVGVNMASRMLYKCSFPDNLNGTDLTPELLSNLPDSTPVYLVGGAPGVVEKAAEGLTRQCPNIRIAGTQHGYFTAKDEPIIAAQIEQSGAMLVLVGMGHPRQEIWAVANSRAITCPLICVGALIDRLAGHVPRAPKLMRRIGAEWLYRLALEPRRLAGRYLLGNATFLFRIGKQKLKLQRGIM